jgi:glycosyltransferase involved in cell wall biosynthesis
MADTLVRRGLSRKNIHVLNNFIVDFNNSLNGIPSQPIRKTEDELHVLFAGNIGNFQGLDSVIEAAKLLKCKKQIHFNFMGEGLAKDNLMRQSGELLGETVFFMPYQPIEIAFAAMQDADLGLISLKPNVYKVAFPSKTMMYLAAGCPLLAIVEKESELAKEIVNNNMGYVCSPNPVKIAETINRAWTERETLKKNRERIGNMAQEVFGRDVILDEWSKIVKFLW